MRDFVEQFQVLIRAFAQAPMPGDDVCLGARNKQAFVVKVGAVDKDLVIDPPGMTDDEVENIYKPAPAKASFRC